MNVMTCCRSSRILQSKLAELQSEVNEKKEWISPDATNTLLKEREIEFNILLEEVRQSETAFKESFMKEKEKNQELARRVQELEAQAELATIMQSSSAEQEEYVT